MLPQLLPEGSPLVTVDEQAVFSIGGGFDGNAAANCTANARLSEAPAATVPTASVHVEPSWFVGAQLHPGEELPGKNVERAGTVSVNSTPAAS